MSTKKFFLFTTILSLLLVPIGTLTHELGHFFVAKSIGVEAKVTYKSTVLLPYENLHLTVKDEVDRTLLPCSSERFLSSSYFDWYELSFLLKPDTRETYLQYLRDLKLVTFGGPLVTIIIGSIAFTFLLIRVKTITLNSPISAFVLGLLSLFWLRELLTLFVSLFIKKINVNFSDEVILAKLFNLPSLSIISFLGLISLLVFIKVITMYEKKIRSIFILSLGVGSFLGYIIWFGILGKLILP